MFVKAAAHASQCTFVCCQVTRFDVVAWRFVMHVKCCRYLCVGLGVLRKRGVNTACCERQGMDEQLSSTRDQRWRA